MLTILYAEDDPEHRIMVQFILDNKNITLLQAVDGQDAIQKIKQNRPDLILLDLFMPKIDGFGVMKAVQADPETSHIPIIVLSAWPTGDNRQRAKLAGATDFIAKPYEPRMLLSMVGKYLKPPG